MPSRPKLIGAVALAALMSACGSTSPGAGETVPDDALLRRDLPELAEITSESRIDPLLGEAADSITQERFGFEVRCWSLRDWRDVIRSLGLEPGSEEEEGEIAGFIYRQNLVNLSPPVCDRLARFAHGPPRRREGRPDLRDAEAIVVFSHEIGHALVGDNEAATECWAVQNASTVAEVLGAQPAFAQQLAERYFEEVYPLLPDEYHSAECRNRGSFDQQPDSDDWP